MKINKNEWKPEFLERLNKHKEAINYMEEMYGIGIEEWETTMNPLHYLDALGKFYQLKQAAVICSVCDECNGIGLWKENELDKEIICPKCKGKQTDI